MENLDQELRKWVREDLFNCLINLPAMQMKMLADFLAKLAPKKR